jgi:hypothetical protein
LEYASFLEIAMSTFSCHGIGRCRQAGELDLGQIVAASRLPA